MIEGILKTQTLENVPTQETERRNYKTNSGQKTADSKDNNDAKGEQNIAVKKAIENVENIARFFNRKIQFEVEKDLDIIVVKLIDGETGKVIRQIPPEEVIKLSKSAKNSKGLLIDKEG